MALNEENIPLACRLARLYPGRYKIVFVDGQPRYVRHNDARTEEKEVLDWSTVLTDHD